MKELKIGDLERPKWVDEWLWKGVVSQLSDLVIARVLGASVVVCPCCSEIHCVPILEQEPHAIGVIFDKLGVQTLESKRAHSH
jgi:hypothetical protein